MTTSSAQDLQARVEELEAALRLAYDAMNYMGDVANSMDIVTDADMAATEAAFEAVAKALGEE